MSPSSRVWREPLSRHLPFAAVAVFGQVSALWPPGPTDVAAFRISTALLVVSGVLAVRQPGRPNRTWLVRAAVYVSSVSFLMLSTGGFGSGLGALLFLPVVGVALYGEPWESAAVVSFVLTATFAVSAASGPQEASATARRLLLLACLTSMLSLAIHVLRRRLNESNDQTSALLRREQEVNAAARQLSQLSDPPAITALGIELATKLTVLPGVDMARSFYFRVEGGRMSVEDGTGQSATSEDTSWAIEDHPWLAEAVRTRRPVRAALELDRIEPSVRSSVLRQGVTHCVWVPVCPDGELHGVLSVGSRGQPVPDECFDRVVALGHILELALSNWAAHEKLKERATADERRRIARDLHDGLAHELAFIASKTRGGQQGTSQGLNVGQLAGAADRALDEARRAITVLSVVEPQSLSDAITQTAEDLGSRLGLEIELDLAPDDREIPGQVTENVLRIVREAITNAATHGRCGRVSLRLEQGDRCRLLIEDDGCGFDLSDAPARGEGFGLVSMRERADSIEAELGVESAPGRGTRISVAFG